MIKYGTKNKRPAMNTLYVLNFLLGAQIALVVYFNSNFLESRGVSEELLGTLYSIGSFISICVLIFLPKILRKIGNYKTVMLASFVGIVLFVALAFSSYEPLTLIVFILAITFPYTPLAFGLDIFLENHNNDEENTGDIRGSFLTALNIAFVISPIIAGFLLTVLGYKGLYLISAFILIPFLLIVRYKFKDFKDPEYIPLELKPILGKLINSKDLRASFAMHFLIRFFFAIMVVYMPIYLIRHIGFSFEEIGVMFSIMLLPFVFLEYPLGHFADKKFGEKEFLFVGFLIMAVSVVAIPFISGAHFLLWTFILFFSRVGAAIVEVMSEIYFFKHVDGDDLDTISSYRALRPVAYIVAPMIGSALLFINGFHIIFITLMLFMIVGVLISVFLKDTK